MFTLEGIAYNCLIRNFQTLMDDSKSRKRLFSATIPPIIAEKVLHQINEYYLGVPPNILKHFTKNNTILKDIAINGRRIKGITLMQFLRGHNLNSAALINFNLIRVEKWIKYLKVSTLKQLSLEGSCFLDRIVVQEENHHEQGGEETKRLNMELLQTKPPSYKGLGFKCLVQLSLANTDINDVHFLHFTKDCPQLRHLNISSTNITDLRLLEKFQNLESLDCSYPNSTNVYDTYLALLKLKSLKVLDISKSDRIGYGALILRYKGPNEKGSSTSTKTSKSKEKDWHLSDFLNNAMWENMTHFNLSGNWSRPIKSISNFINNHKKLEFFGLDGCRVDERKVNALIRNGKVLEQLTNFSKDKIENAIMRMKCPELQNRYSESFVENLKIPRIYGNLNYDNMIKDILQEKKLDICEVMAHQLNAMKHTAFLYHDATKIFGSCFLVIDSIDISESEYFLSILKSCSQIFINHSNKSFRDKNIHHLLNIFTKYYKYIHMV
ncbi:DgyrCDS11469 [Dimorphilus gyrociliatus]|uniref:DgyrCDS11469 n=1 Tax=Dimorphilus gyrociliatus TaxID=2664684 RepID=A0A7I8W4R5_9ANNE|nr:DgyrCDS11469 [Dimorphilus gyrociliatus]